MLDIFASMWGSRARAHGVMGSGSTTSARTHKATGGWPSFRFKPRARNIHSPNALFSGAKATSTGNPAKGNPIIHLVPPPTKGAYGSPLNNLALPSAKPHKVRNHGRTSTVEWPLPSAPKVAEVTHASVGKTDMHIQEIWHLPSKEHREAWQSLLAYYRQLSVSRTLRILASAHYEELTPRLRLRSKSHAGLRDSVGCVNAVDAGKALRLLSGSSREHIDKVDELLEAYGKVPKNLVKGVLAGLKNAVDGCYPLQACLSGRDLELPSQSHLTGLASLLNLYERQAPKKALGTLETYELVEKQVAGSAAASNPPAGRFTPDEKLHRVGGTQDHLHNAKALYQSYKRVPVAHLPALMLTLKDNAGADS